MSFEPVSHPSSPIQPPFWCHSTGYRAFWATVMLASSLFLPMKAARAEAVSSSERSSTVAPRREAIPSRLSSRLENRLNEAYDLALGHLETYPECEALFTPLDDNATRSLSRSIYVPASARHEQIVCQRGAAAFTAVGGRVTGQFQFVHGDGN